MLQSNAYNVQTLCSCHVFANYVNVSGGNVDLYKEGIHSVLCPASPFLVGCSVSESKSLYF